MSTDIVLATNTAGVIEHPGLDSNPYLVDADGRPYVPTGDGGVVLGLGLGDSVFGYDTDHASPGVSIVHPEQAARHALTAFACLGNRVSVRSGAAAGATGAVLGKRGEQGRVLAWFEPDVLARLVPGDAMAVRAFGQGARLPEPLVNLGGQLLNIDPGLLAMLPLDLGESGVSAQVRGSVGSKLIGNGIGRPAHQWDLDLQVDKAIATDHGLGALAIGDLVAVRNLDVRHNAGYRSGWLTIGVALTTTSPRPGHGVGLMPILCLPETAAQVEVRAEDHVGVTADILASVMA